jgi:hypothetical protein
MKYNRFSQEEYSRLLDTHNARLLGLTQSECELILMGAEATREQARMVRMYICITERVSLQTVEGRAESMKAF